MGPGHVEIEGSARLVRQVESPQSTSTTTLYLDPPLSGSLLVSIHLRTSFAMSSRISRTAMASLRNASASAQRIAQVQRHFSSTTSARQEIQEAYILSAARTPTAKVRLASCDDPFAH